MILRATYQLCLLFSIGFYGLSMPSTAAEVGDAKDPVVEDKVDPKVHIIQLAWTDTENWPDSRNAWFQNEVLWPFFDQVTKKEYSLIDSDYEILIKGIAYASWKSKNDHFTAGFLTTLKSEKKLSDDQIRKIFDSIKFKPAKEKLRKDYSILANQKSQDPKGKASD